MPPDSKVLIIGGGVIGLSLAWQLRRRAVAVTVLERGGARAPSAPPPSLQASQAAAGMLAVEDPHNPPELLPLSRFSRSLYHDFLLDLQGISGLPVPFQTDRTLQTMPDGRVTELAEHSLDPRQLWAALRAAAERLGTEWIAVGPEANPPRIYGDALAAPQPAHQAFDSVVYTAGAWNLGQGPTPLPVAPRKGQMLRVGIPSGLRLGEVHRAGHVYVVPRRYGPQAGTALIGATVEDAGFDPALVPGVLKTLRDQAAELVPELADEQQAPFLEAWAGFRPATPDLLPVLGPVMPGELPPGQHLAPNPRQWVATGHFRNGILLAPATAAVLADLLEGKTPAVALDAFAPSRFPTSAEGDSP